MCVQPVSFLHGVSAQLSGANAVGNDNLFVFEGCGRPANRSPREDVGEMEVRYLDLSKWKGLGPALTLHLWVSLRIRRNLIEGCDPRTHRILLSTFFP